MSGQFVFWAADQYPFIPHINGKCIRNPSLSYGFAGIALYFYTLQKEDNANHYDEVAEYFSDKIVPIHPKINFDYFAGLSGICYSIDYLSRNKLLAINVDEILGEMDPKFFYEVACADSTNLPLLWSLGKYLLARYNSSPFGKRDIFYEFLIHVTDKLGKFYLERTTANYELNIIDFKISHFLKECEDLRINYVQVTAILRHLNISVNNFGETDLNLLQLNLRSELNLNLGSEMISKSILSPDVDDLSQVFLFLNLYTKTGNDNLKNQAIKIVNNVLKKYNPVDLDNICGINKLNIHNYSLSGFAGLGLILLSAKNEFKDLTWIDLFI